MQTVIILGLRIPFCKLWKKTKVIERPNCNCNSDENFTFCPYCGIKKQMNKIKVYKSLITGEETTNRSLNSIMDHLYNNEMDVYDTNPRGYTDDYIYIYLTNPPCLLTVNDKFPTSMDAVTNSNELHKKLLDNLGEDLWMFGEYGLWAFNDNPNEEKKTIIIPLGPFNDNNSLED